MHGGHNVIGPEAHCRTNRYGLVAYLVEGASHALPGEPERADGLVDGARQVHPSVGGE